jgi:PAS domain S-box-containing protein
MLWLYLLGAVTVLGIALRRVLRRQKPLDNELYTNKVAVDHVHSGVAWVGEDGAFGSVNQALADTLGTLPASLVGRGWLTIFPGRERARVEEARTQMLLQGIATLDTYAERSDGVQEAVNVRLVALHDHKMRLVGHHCMIHDVTRQRELETQVRSLEARVRELQSELESAKLGIP